jgi:hypothetical protein
MTKDALIKSLEALDIELKRLERIISKQTSKQIRDQPTKEAVKKCARGWFENITKQLEFYGVAIDNVAKFDKLFNSLLSMTFKDSMKSKYLETLKQIRQSFNEDISIPVHIFTGDISNFDQLDAILTSLGEDEKPLMKEAINCARAGYLRATIVLGWAAAINRMHKIVELMGFDEFNKKSKQLNDINEGRYKRFKKYFHVVNLPDLQASVFDDDLLWVLEFCDFFDNNQHERLSACFVMRNTSAHPGASVNTEDNVVSFYSDLKSIIFDNPKFKLPESASSAQKV